MAGPTVRRVCAAAAEDHPAGAKCSMPNISSSSPRLQVTTSMHRRAGSQREWVQAVTDGGLYAVSEMREWQEECGHGVVQRPGCRLANHP
ncbi:oxidoreductase family, NAD-binding [Klebsiella pneumoniae]|uniref:Oxidoreductase family, NAD-binding n=1 Tax=Klebsiella pneumoniae TaxID=573 RepID=A0A4P0Y406_KLEPN|nr:oxidoreductase family, NAD-binding [Klebsiella pneumoniae]